jgi:hypothetical protein
LERYFIEQNSKNKKKILKKKFGFDDLKRNYSK